MSVLLNAVFLDMLDFDVLNLNRINALLERRSDGEHHDLRPARACVLRPARDLGELAAEHERELPKPLRLLLRGAGTREETGFDFLSLVLFEPGYIGRLLALGEADAARDRDVLKSFLGVPG